MKLNPELIRRNILGDDVFIPIGQTAIENNGVFVMSPVGSRIWELLEQGMKTDQLVPTMLEEYDVEEPILRSDVDEFIRELTRLGMLIED